MLINIFSGYSKDAIQIADMAWANEYTYSEYRAMAITYGYGILDMLAYRTLCASHDAEELGTIPC